MDALIEAAVPVAAAAGAPALEAYPVDTAVPAHTTNLFPGSHRPSPGTASRSWPAASRTAR